MGGQKPPGIGRTSFVNRSLIKVDARNARLRERAQIALAYADQPFENMLFCCDFCDHDVRECLLARSHDIPIHIPVDGQRADAVSAGKISTPVFDVKTRYLLCTQPSRIWSCLVGH